MVFRHCGDFLSLKVAEGFVNRPLVYDATMLTMLENENISASGTSCTRAWLGSHGVANLSLMLPYDAIHGPIKQGAIE